MSKIFYNVKPAIDRFCKFIKWNGDCLEWQGSLSRGYGTFRLRSESTQAHRFSYLYHNGEIPDGLSVLHKCDNRKCVNPDHLYVGTQQQNIDDRENRGRNYHSNQTHCKHGHEFTENNTYRWKTLRICRICRANTQRELRLTRKLAKVNYC